MASGLHGDQGPIVGAEMEGVDGSRMQAKDVVRCEIHCARLVGHC
jgi:hypothetical protein